MPEIFIASTPVQADPGATMFRIASILLAWDRSYIEIVLREWDGTQFTGRQITAIYEDAVARNILQAFNKVNLSTISLHHRVMARLIADGKVPAGTASGNPD